MDLLINKRNLVMTHKFTLICLFIVSLTISCSGNVGDVPKELFNIKLGTIYDFSKVTKESVGDFPIKKFTGSNQFLGNGTHFYFEPKTKNSHFPYKEIKENSKENFFKTNFQLYLLPIVPSSVNSIDELDSTKFNMEVGLIMWSDFKKDSQESYLWSKNMCKTFGSSIKIIPEIFESFEFKNYTCKFNQDNRVLSIFNSGETINFSLQYQPDVFRKKEGDFETLINKLKVKEILR